MKSAIGYWVWAFFPVIALLSLWKSGLLRDPLVFLILLFVYACIYRPVIMSLKLIALGKIARKDFFKSFIPFYYDTKYFSLLFFNRE